MARPAKWRDVPSLRAAWWAWRAIRAAQRQVDRDGGLAQVDLPDVPELPERAERGVDFVLSRSGQRCLAQAYVRQQWHLAHGDPRDVVIGVLNDPDFRAHAWLDGDPPELQRGYQELTRRPAT